MNTSQALQLDREVTLKDNEIATLKRQLQEALVYQKELEAALISAPLYRPAGSLSRAEFDYVARRDSWFDSHRRVIERAARNPMESMKRFQSKAMHAVRKIRNRVDTLIRQRDAGDDTVIVPSMDQLWGMITKGLAAI